MKKLKKNVKASLIACTAIAGIGGVLGIANIQPATAYFTDGDVATNQMHIGSNEITITEDFPSPSPASQGNNLYTKAVQIDNTGNVPCYIRVFLNFSDDYARTHATVNASSGSYSWDNFLTHLPENWIYKNDDKMGPYFYYTKVVNPGESTSKLINSFNVNFEKKTDAANHQFDVYVYSESVQSTDNDGKEYTGTDAWQKAWQDYLKQ